MEYICNFKNQVSLQVEISIYQRLCSDFLERAAPASFRDIS